MTTNLKLDQDHYYQYEKVMVKYSSLRWDMVPLQQKLLQLDKRILSDKSLLDTHHKTWLGRVVNSLQEQETGLLAKIHQFLLHFNFYVQKSMEQHNLKSQISASSESRQKVSEMLGSMEKEIEQLKIDNADLLASYSNLNDIQNVFNFMVSICGGKEKYEQLPELTITKKHYRSETSDYVDNISPTDMSAPVMRFTELHGRPGIAIRAKKCGAPAVQTFFQRYTKEASWTDGGYNHINVSDYIIDRGLVQEKPLKELQQLIATGSLNKVRLV